MTNPSETAVFTAEQFGEDQRNHFVARANAPGSFIQPNPDPVVFTEDFLKRLESLKQHVSAAVEQFGATGRDYR